MRHRKIEQIGSHRKQSRGMYELLREYSRAGIKICLDGKEADPGRVASVCIREGVSYMMDFIPASFDSQQISSIDFTRIGSPDPEHDRSQGTTSRHTSSGPDIMPGLS